MTHKPRPAKLTDIIKYISISGDDELTGLPAGQKSILILDANVFSYLHTHKRQKSAFEFSAELAHLLSSVHKRQIRVDATLASMERGMKPNMLLPGLSEFSKWFDDFYEGKSLFKVDTLKPLTGPTGTALNYEAAANLWVCTFLPAYATIIKGLSIAQENSRVSDFSKNLVELCSWAAYHNVSMGLSAILIMGLFAKEPSAISILRYNKGDCITTKIKKAHNSARDLIYFEHLLNLQANTINGGVLLATADVGLFNFIRLNKINYFKATAEETAGISAIYSKLNNLLEVEKRVVFEQVLTQPVRQIVDRELIKSLDTAIKAAKQELLAAHECPY